MSRLAEGAMTSGGIQIERVRESSAWFGEALQRLVPLLGSGRHAPPAEDVEAMLADPQVHVLAARLPDPDRRVVGMVCLVFYRVPTGMRARIEDLVVAEEGRNAGVGRLLMESAVRAARDAGAHVVDLTCNPRREAANRLYARLGFERWETNVYRLVLD
jgi:GNAT superfamily N-acetyltransferase